MRRVNHKQKTPALIISAPDEIKSLCHTRQAWLQACLRLPCPPSWDEHAKFQHLKDNENLTDMGLKIPVWLMCDYYLILSWKKEMKEKLFLCLFAYFFVF